MTQIAATAPVVAQPIDPTQLFGKIVLPGALQIAPFRQIWGALLLIHLSRWVEITVVEEDGDVDDSTGVNEWAENNFSTTIGL